MARQKQVRNRCIGNCRSTVVVHCSQGTLQTQPKHSSDRRAYTQSNMCPQCKLCMHDKDCWVCTAYSSRRPHGRLLPIHNRQSKHQSALSRPVEWVKRTCAHKHNCLAACDALSASRAHGWPVGRLRPASVTYCCQLLVDIASSNRAARLPAAHLATAADCCLVAVKARWVTCMLPDVETANMRMRLERSDLRVLRSTPAGS